MIPHMPNPHSYFWIENHFHRRASKGNQFYVHTHDLNTPLPPGCVRTKWMPLNESCSVHGFFLDGLKSCLDGGSVVPSYQMKVYVLPWIKNNPIVGYPFSQIIFLNYNVLSKQNIQANDPADDAHWNCKMGNDVLRHVEPSAFYVIKLAPLPRSDAKWAPSMYYRIKSRNMPVYSRASYFTHITSVHIV